MAKKFKKEKFPIPAEEAEAILRMDPKVLTTEIARLQINIEAEKENIKNDPELKQLMSTKDALEADLVEKDPEVQKLKNELEDLKQKIKETCTSEELDQAKMDIKHWKKGISSGLVKDKKKLKFMLKTFKSHLHSGVIKLG